MANETQDQSAANGITVIQLVSRFGRGSFGLGYAALNLTAALHRRGINVYLASLDAESDAQEACSSVGLPKEKCLNGMSIGPPSFRFAPSLANRILALSKSGRTIVHSHGTWTHVSFIAGNVSRRLQCPLVISPHGEFEPYALSVSRIKKAIAESIFARRNVRNAACIWALTTHEEQSIRAYGFKGRIAVIPSGVSRATPCDVQEVEEFRQRHGIKPGKRVLLFLSRIARIKNLPLLLHAFADAVRVRTDWILVIAGADHRGHIHEVRQIIRELGLQEFVRLIGPVTGRDKAISFSSASLFVLPSLSEGLPIAALEAMQYGKPTFTTDGWTLPISCPEVFGWRVPQEQNAFGVALLGAMMTPEEELVKMGQIARLVVREHFDWDRVAEEASNVYGSLI